MRQLITYALCAIGALLLLSCWRPESNGNYVLANRTDHHIGFKVGAAVPFDPTIVDPHRAFEHYEKVRGEFGPQNASFTISNLEDTTSIWLSPIEVGKILHTDPATKQDSILKEALLRYGNYTYHWTITDKVLSVMTHDERLLTEFPDFYKK